MAIESIRAKEIYQLEEEKPNYSTLVDVGALKNSAPRKKVAISFNTPTNKHHKALSKISNMTIEIPRPSEQYLVTIDGYHLNNAVDSTINYVNAKILNYSESIYFLYQYENVFEYGLTEKKNEYIKMKHFKNGLLFEGDSNSVKNIVLTLNFLDTPNAPKATGTSPLSGFVNRSEKIEFSWELDELDQWEQFTQSSAELHIKKTSDSTFSIYPISTIGHYELNKNILDASTYEWKIKIIVDDGQNTFTPIYRISTVDTIPTISGISPINEVKYGEIDFVWEYQIETGTKQKAFDLQISQNGSDWKTVANHIESSSTFYTLTYQAGRYYWRVRGYNQDNVAGEWSEHYYFVNNALPQDPTITSIHNGGRIHIDWSSSDQVAYELSVQGSDYLYESGAIYTTKKSHFINDYLINGVYLIKIRIYNIFGKKSEWTSTDYRQNIIKKPFRVEVLNISKGVQLSWEENENFLVYYILKNGIPISKTSENSYIDFTCNGQNEYIIRGVEIDDNFSDSMVVATFKCTQSALVYKGKEINLSKRINEKPKTSFSLELENVVQNYLGRSKPVHTIGKMKIKTWEISCTLQEEMLDLIGEICYYRNIFGDQAYVVFTAISCEHFTLGSDVSLVLEETDFKEGIEYELSS